MRWSSPCSDRRSLAIADHVRDQLGWSTLIPVPHVLEDISGLIGVVLDVESSLNHRLVIVPEL